MLDRRKHRARFYQADLEHGAEVRSDARRPQSVAHQRAAPGAKFDQPHRIGRAHRRPHFRRPEADQFAEHLADFGRRREIARRSERIARPPSPCPFVDQGRPAIDIINQPLAAAPAGSQAAVREPPLWFEAQGGTGPP